MPQSRPAPSKAPLPLTIKLAVGVMTTSVTAYLLVRYGNPDLITFLAGMAVMFLIVAIFDLIPKKARPDHWLKLIPRFPRDREAHAMAATTPVAHPHPRELLEALADDRRGPDHA